MNLLDNPFGMTPRQKPDEIYRIMVFGVVMIGLFLAFDTYVEKPQRDAMLRAQQQHAAVNVPVAEAAKPLPREAALTAEKGPRAHLENKEMSVSLALRGARIDDLVLKNYFETIEHVKNVALLSPSASDNPQMLQFGWLAQDKSVGLPDNDTNWTLVKQAPQSVTLRWENPQHVVFEQTITLDDNALFTVQKTVTNKGATAVTVYPYGRVAREGLPPTLVHAAILHEGPIAYVSGKLHEDPFKRLDKEKLVELEGDHGWAGITEKYWLAALLNPASTGENHFRFVAGDGSFGRTLYQTDARGAAETVAPGASATHTTYAFVGPKKVTALDTYGKTLKLDHFDLAVDFGRFYFLTRPFFALLHFLSEKSGSFAIGLLLMSLCIRGATFPLANNTFRSFAKLRKLNPQMTELKEKYGADRQRMQQELYKFYQKEKVNPAAGCVTVLLQIPIFFALYKVLFVTFEMRQQPFFGWIKDMSAPDPTNIFNLFGLIPIDLPAALHIGVWPCVYCATMLMLQRLQPPAADASQRTMMKFMPFFFTFMLAKFPAGLVIYWSWSNLLSLLQQSYIMKSMGVKVYLFHSDKHKKADVEILDPADDVIVQVVESTDVSDEQPKAITPPKRTKKK